jgi:hypothetical protein
MAKTFQGNSKNSLDTGNSNAGKAAAAVDLSLSHAEGVFSHGFGAPSHSRSPQGQDEVARGQQAARQIEKNPLTVGQSLDVQIPLAPDAFALGCLKYGLVA